MYNPPADTMTPYPKCTLCLKILTIFSLTFIAMPITTPHLYIALNLMKL